MKSFMILTRFVLAAAVAIGFSGSAFGTTTVSMTISSELDISSVCWDKSADHFDIKVSSSYVTEFLQHIDGCTDDELLDLLARVKSLDISGSNIKRFSVGYFDFFPNLEVLDLKGSRELKILSEGCWRWFSFLSLVDLRDCQLLGSNAQLYDMGYKTLGVSSSNNHKAPVPNPAVKPVLAPTTQRSEDKRLVGRPWKYPVKLVADSKAQLSDLKHKIDQLKELAVVPFVAQATQRPKGKRFVGCSGKCKMAESEVLANECASIASQFMERELHIIEPVVELEGFKHVSRSRRRPKKYDGYELEEQPSSKRVRGTHKELVDCQASTQPCKDAAHCPACYFGDRGDNDSPCPDGDENCRCGIGLCEECGSSKEVRIKHHESLCGYTKPKTCMPF
jgi:hypothetical protein